MIDSSTEPGKYSREVAMIRYIAVVLAALLTPSFLFAGAGKPDIVVITQNQYLGADLTPIIAAQSPGEYNLAVLDALFSIADNNFPERAVALAESIADRDAHLVGLQEVFKFDCLESGTIPGACLLFSSAMNDHLELTLDALDDLGADYYIAGVVENLTIPDAGFGLPGLPVFLNEGDAIPDVFIQVLDRDVILARGDVSSSTVTFPCSKPSVDGCNYDVIASAETLAGTIDVERGFVGVDALVDGRAYRFVNTHLEIRYPAPEQDAPLIQAGQASQLVGTMTLAPPPPGTKLLLVGDINSSPLDPVFLSSFGLAYPPYQQLATGVSVWGTPISLPYADVWNLRPGKPPGNTCCEAADLSNRKSMLDERIDVIFSLMPPSRVKANILNNNPDDKTPSGLWPSDHASVVARLYYSRAK
jgi:hypothetical protein